MTVKQIASAEKREQLIQLSNAAKLAIEMNGLDCTINEAIVNLFYKGDDPNITELKTFAQWKEEGFKIKKGAKSYVVWGKPRKAKQATEGDAEEQKDGQPDEKSYKFFPMAYLFSNAQVEKMIQE